MTEGKLRVGIIGAGDIAMTMRVPRLRATGRAEVVALCRRDSAKLRLAQEHLGVPEGYTDWRVMLEKSELDAVCITTPHDLHYEQTMGALKHGLHALVDKPMALTSDEAWEVARAADKSDRVVMHVVGPRFTGAWRAAKKAVEAGAIGQLRQVSGVQCSPRRFLWDENLPQSEVDAVRAWFRGYRNKQGIPEGLHAEWLDGESWQRDPARVGGGMLANMGLHHLDLGLWLGGAPPVEVIAFGESAGLKVPVCITAQARLANGVILSMSSADIGAQGGRWSLLGDDGMLADDGKRGVEIKRVFDGEALEPEQGETMEAAFVASIMDGAPNPSPARDGAMDVALLEAIYRSIREHAIVGVDIPSEYR